MSDRLQRRRRRKKRAQWLEDLERSRYWKSPEYRRKMKLFWDDREARAKELVEWLDRIKGVEKKEDSHA